MGRHLQRIVFGSLKFAFKLCGIVFAEVEYMKGYGIGGFVFCVCLNIMPLCSVIVAKAKKQRIGYLCRVIFVG